MRAELQIVRNDLLGDLEHIQEAVEWLINSTPSGAVRNKLTEVNIHLVGAELALKDLDRVEHNEVAAKAK